MQFFTHKRSLPAVPLISLIDILAILLIFFIATTTFKKQESLIKINLPKSSEMEASNEKDIRMVMAVTKDKEIYIEDQLIPIEQLAGALQKFQETNPDVKFEMRTDGEAPVELVVRIWDAAKRAGVDIEKLPLRILLEGGGK
jgi:biopolymer transport protein ExbD